MQKKEITGILVGAAPLGAEKTLLTECLDSSDCISVAADGGLSFFVEKNTAPDYWLGDKDSLEDGVFRKAKEAFPDLNPVPCSPEKDDTDMRLGVLKLRELGAKTIYVFGGLGGERLDHTIANIQMLHEFCVEGIRIILISEKESVFVLKAGQSVRYGKECEGILSVFSLTDQSKISIRDFYYEFDGVIDNKRVFTVSNQFHKKGGTVEVFEGAALIVRSGIYDSGELIFSED